MAIHIKNQQRSKSLNLRRVRKTLASALSLLGLEEAELSVIFVGSRRMKFLNTLYRGIPKETDVLSFPMTEDLYIDDASSRLSFPLVGNHSPKGLRTSRSDKTGGLPSPCTSSPAWPLILGDIVISVPRTMVQAKAYCTPFYEELLRLLVHGLLHLLGYDHEKSRHQKVRMEKKEKEILHAVSHLA
jgi:probable rRNA maturation factor